MRSLLPTLGCCLALVLSALGEPLRWEVKDGYRVAKLSVPAMGKTGFALLSPTQTGVLFTNQLGYKRSEANQNLLNGAGVAAGDYDGDGLCDLYFCNLEGVNGLFRNLGNWTFENTTAKAGAACTNQTSRGATFADVNGDGKLDLLVTSLSGPNACLLNQGDGRFKDITQAAGLVINRAGGHSITLADVEGDGDLDLYVVNYGENSLLRSGGAISVRTIGGKTVVSGRHAARVKLINGQLLEMGEPDFLFLNDGKGIFSAMPWNTGAFLTEDGKPLKSAPWDLGLSAMFRDVNDDGAPDLYVCNDFQSPDRFWINNGRGQFRLIDPLAVRSTCHFSMGVDFADLDRDGHDEFFVSDMLSRNQVLRMRQMGATNPPPEHVGETLDRPQIRRNTLFWNRGDGTYAEIANYAGVDASEWTWSVVFLDVDLDGYEDLLVANGHAYDTQDLDMMEKVPANAGQMLGGVPAGKSLKDYPPLETPNVLFRNRGDLTFEEVSTAWGFNATNISHGISLADFDNDGDMDAAVSCLWTAPLIYRNESSAPRVAVRLKGKTGNVQGIGARIKVTGGAVPIQTQQMIAGGRYLSGDDPMRVFAAGKNPMTIEVTWRSGQRSVVSNAMPNHIYEIDESRAEAAPAQATRMAAVTSLFTNVTAVLPHVHEDLISHEMEQQPLLPKALGQGGPGVAWHDVDADGDDDLIIAGRTAVFRNEGKFVTMPFDLPRVDDHLGVVGCMLTPGKRSLLVSEGALWRYDFGDGATNAFSASGGAIAVADVDGDGDLDVFTGGRPRSGRYPEANLSKLFKNVHGRLTPDSELDAGIVNGAVFSDLTGDGLPELVLGCEWGPIRVYRNDGGKLHDTKQLARFVGWWNGVTTGDVDGDGRLDIVAGNWGLNSSYGKGPARLYYGDFDGNSSVDLIEATLDSSGRAFQRHDLRLLARGLPLLKTRFPTHRAFSETDLQGVLGDWKAEHVEATEFRSMVFYNRGDRFEAVPLTREAQWAPAFGVNVADFDGNGSEDIFLSQNFFAMRPEEPRLDAGRGLLLLGPKLTMATNSGIAVYGEQRGSAFSDFDHDGRVDLVVTQNRGATQLFKNQAGKPGLRVRLKGGSGNPEGVGAVIHLKFGDRIGPAREVHAGSGYLSQDSSIQVLAMPAQPTALVVRWPGGKTTTTEVPAGAKEITASF